MSDIQKLQNDVNTLKVRVFDLSETLTARDQELGAYRQLLGKICELLEIDGQNGVDPNAVVGAIESLLPVKEDFAVPDEELVEEELEDGETAA